MHGTGERVFAEPAGSLNRLPLISHAYRVAIPREIITSLPTRGDDRSSPLLLR